MFKIATIQIKSCRSCGDNTLTNVFSLGNMAVVDFTDSGKSKLMVPLELVLCANCKLLQLRHTTPPDLLYGETYWYMSGVNQTMRNELADITQSVEDRVDLQKNDIVIDIGCNDGTLLSSYKIRGLTKIGFDPAKNLARYSRSKLSHLFVDFFHKEPFKSRFGNRKAKVMTAISMFYDLVNPNKFLSDVVECLDEDGVLVIQQNYLASMIRLNAFDNICHEHLEYYSLQSIENLLKKHGLEVFDVEERSLNGGSFRKYIQHVGAGRKVSSNVYKMRVSEEKLKLGMTETYIKFAKTAKQSADNIHDVVVDLVKNHKTIYVYGASTRGNTLLQYCRLDHNFITAAAERNPIKYGKKTVATKIPIVSEAEVREMKPDYMLVLPWFFEKEFLRREKKYLESGGKFIYPLPRLRIVG